MYSVKYRLVDSKPYFQIGDDLLTRWEFTQMFVLTGRFRGAKTVHTKMFWSQVFPAVARIQRAWRRYKKLPTPPMSWWFQARQRALDMITVPEGNEEVKAQMEKQIAMSNATLKRRKEQYEQLVQIKKTRRRELYDRSRREYTAAMILCSFTTV